MKLKRVVVLVLCLVCCITCFTACSGKIPVFNRLKIIAMKGENSDGLYINNSKYLSYDSTRNKLIYCLPVSDSRMLFLRFNKNFSSCEVVFTIKDEQFVDNINLSKYDGYKEGVEKLENELLLTLIDMGFKHFFEDFDVIPADIGMTNYKLDG